VPFIGDEQTEVLFEQIEEVEGSKFDFLKSHHYKIK
jgi:hypothetical protein